jgi:hypothetical protein
MSLRRTECCGSLGERRTVRFAVGQVRGRGVAEMNVCA